MGVKAAADFEAISSRSYKVDPGNPPNAGPRIEWIGLNTLFQER